MIESGYKIRPMTREDWRELAVEKYQGLSIIERLRNTGAYGLPAEVQKERIENFRKENTNG